MTRICFCVGNCQTCIKDRPSWPKVLPWRVPTYYVMDAPVKIVTTDGTNES